MKALLSFPPAGFANTCLTPLGGGTSEGWWVAVDGRRNRVQQILFSFSSLFPSSSGYITFHRRQNRGNKQAVSSLDSSAARQPSSRGTTAKSVRGKDLLCACVRVSNAQSHHGHSLSVILSCGRRYRAARFHRSTLRNSFLPCLNPELRFHSSLTH